MIKIYTSPSCSSCRKVKKWFDEQHIPYEEKSIFSPSLNAEDIQEILRKSENGTADIISERSKIVKEQHIDFEDMKLSELVTFLKKNPTVLKRPIIVDDKKIQVGYNDEDISMFIPAAYKIARKTCSPESCENYNNCPHLLDIDGNIK
ncbi:MAG: Spx/MgsR family RNA polymerase-binding regulatory protein [Bacilli bacterium]